MTFFDENRFVSHGNKHLRTVTMTCFCSFFFRLSNATNREPLSLFVEAQGRFEGDQ